MADAERVIKATRCDWLRATTNVEFARTLHNKRLTDSIFESARRLLSWSGQQHTNVLASLRPAYISQLLGVSRQIIRLLGVSRLMYARHSFTDHADDNDGDHYAYVPRSACRAAASCSQHSGTSQHRATSPGHWQTDSPHTLPVGSYKQLLLLSLV